MSKLLPEERLAMSEYRKRWNGQLGELTVDEFLDQLMQLDYQGSEHQRFMSEHANYPRACEEYRTIMLPIVQRAFEQLARRRRG